ncbi:MAG: DUF3597 family protein, partial [Sphingobium sp.]
MGIFSKIKEKIFGHDAKAAQPPAAAPAPAPAPAPKAAPAPQPSMPAPTQAAPAPTQATPVDVGVVLATMAQMKGGGGNYQSSIVDLLKLLDLESSLAARKELGEELGVNAGADGSAEQNIALH